MKLLIKVPTFERDYNTWFPLYINNITNPDTRILITIDHKDTNPVPEHVENHAIVTVCRGDSDNKVHAINRDINEYPEPWDVLLVGSDDMFPQVMGFDQIILDDMARLYPDTDGCLWYNTEDHQRELTQRFRGQNVNPNSPNGLYNFLRKWICMLPVIGRNYYNRFGYVYHSSYKSFSCDNEQTAEAVKLNKITYLDSKIIRHHHPNWEALSPVADDNTYVRANSENEFTTDQAHFRWRQGRSFPRHLTGVWQKY